MLFANVCAGFICSCYGECRQWRFFFWLLFSVLCIWEGTSIAGVLPFVYTLVCLLLDTPFGRRSVAALPL